MPLSSILYVNLIKFSENRDKELKLGPCFSSLVKRRKILAAEHLLDCVDIGRNQTIAVIIRELSKFLLGNAS